MDVTTITPFINSVTDVLPQLGFTDINVGAPQERSKKIVASGLVLTLGIVGDRKGNVAYVIDTEGAKQIASIMMMGMPVEELDDMAKSAISELSNMLTANASMHFSNDSVVLDISPPTMLTGDSIELSMSADIVTSINFDIDGIKLEVNLSLIPQ